VGLYSQAIVTCGHQSPPVHRAMRSHTPNIFELERCTTTLPSWQHTAPITELPTTNNGMTLITIRVSVIDPHPIVYLSNFDSSTYLSGTTLQSSTQVVTSIKDSSRAALCVRCIRGVIGRPPFLLRQHVRQPCVHVGCGDFCGNSASRSSSWCTVLSLSYCALPTVHVPCLLACCAIN
jgi:hypothetical protein